MATNKSSLDITKVIKEFYDNNSNKYIDVNITFNQVLENGKHYVQFSYRDCFNLQEIHNVAIYWNDGQQGLKEPKAFKVNQKRHFVGFDGEELKILDTEGLDLDESFKEFTKQEVEDWYDMQ